jgi:hypothetical protein
MNVRPGPEVEFGFIPQPGPQTAFCDCPADIVVFGGARGGGKTYATLGEWWIHSEDYGPDAKGLMIRKTREDLKDTIAEGMAMYGAAASWKERQGFFQMANGARLQCAYLENDQDAQNYQGWSLTRVYVEELTQYAQPSGIFKLLATLRSPAGVPCQFRATCNPGGPGHHWVKAWAIDGGPYTVQTDGHGLTRVFIPSRLSDNPRLTEKDPGYENKLRASGTPELVRAWLEGDWNVVEGAFFPEFSYPKHVIPPFEIPNWWTRFRSMDWGSAKPFSVGWWAVVQDDLEHAGKLLPRNAIVRYREWYGMRPGAPDDGLKLPAEEVARGIVGRETNGAGVRERISYGVLDPSAFAVVSGPSIAETLIRHGAIFRRADNTRTTRDKKMGGWDQLRARLSGDRDGRPMLFIFETCRDLIRTLPMAQHDDHNPEDLDTDGEDHAIDDARYACLSRPFIQRVIKYEDKNPYLVSNAFKLKELRD